MVNEFGGRLMIVCQCVDGFSDLNFTGNIDLIKASDFAS